MQPEQQYKMKHLIYILFFFTSASSAQESNAPEVVMPLVQQFIQEAQQHDIPTDQIEQIDSINIESLPYPFSGLHFVYGSYQAIIIHSGKKRAMEKTFYHEIGEMYGLEHEGGRRKIMNTIPNDPWFENESNWIQAKQEFFNQLLWSISSHSSSPSLASSTSVSSTAKSTKPGSESNNSNALLK